jgi:hypothetical protein
VRKAAGKKLIELGVISWAGGVDIAPESLHAKATGKVGVSSE